MPLEIFAGDAAVEQRKANPYAGWGTRDSVNRLEPIASPHFDAPFQIEPGSKVFTIGSCFARNVETELIARGFALPMRDLFKTPAFDRLDVSIINNYGTPSIYNEFAWAFGEIPMNLDEIIVEVNPGRFADLHLQPALRPTSFEEAALRRAKIAEATRTLAECSTLVMTLGLVELWYDTQSATYLNVAPRPSLLRLCPGRFEFHVLTYDETLDFLRRALRIAFKHGRADLNVVLTVSPVALGATHRAMDVMVANTYSKSLLRTAAETVVYEFPRVAYFPSYESVVLTDRRIAIMDDLVHPTRPIVAFNVGRMIAAYTRGEDQSEITNEAEAVVAARLARDRSDLAFFVDQAEWVARSDAFAVENAAMVELFDNERALAILERAPGGSAALVVAKARVMTALGRVDEVIDELEERCRTSPRDREVWGSLIDAYAAKHDIEGVDRTSVRWGQALPNRRLPALIRVARALRQLGDAPRAVAKAREAVALAGDDHFMAGFELVSALIAAGDLAGASEAIARVRIEDADQKAALGKTARQIAELQAAGG